MISLKSPIVSIGLSYLDLSTTKARFLDSVTFPKVLKISSICLAEKVSTILFFFYSKHLLRKFLNLGCILDLWFRCLQLCMRSRLGCLPVSY